MLLDFRKAEQKDLPAARMDDAILVQNHLVYPLVLYTLHRPGLDLGLTWLALQVWSILG